MIFPNKQSGFTIIELLVGLVAASILVLAALSLYVTQHKQFVVQEEITDMQGNVRAAATALASSIRMAGYNIPASMAIETYNSNPDTIVIIFDSGAVQNVQLSADMPQPSAELKCVGYDLSGINEGDWIYIYDPEADMGEFLLATEVQNSDHIQHNTMVLSRVYPAGSMVMKINRIRFFIDQADSTHPNLMIQTFGSAPEVFAENIIDLNFRYFLSSGAIVTQTNTPEDIRMVEIDVLGRTSSPDPEFFQDYRTRNFTLRVKVRNLGID